MGAGMVVKTVLHARIHVRHIYGAVNVAVVEITIIAPLNTIRTIIPFVSLAFLMFHGWSCGGSALKYRARTDRTIIEVKFFIFKYQLKSFFLNRV